LQLKPKQALASISGSKVISTKHKIGNFTPTFEPEMLESQSKAQKT